MCFAWMMFVGFLDDGMLVDREVISSSLTNVG